MVVKDFKYIIKRIIIGVGIALALMFIKGNLIMNVEAQNISSKMEIASSNGSVLYTTNNMGENYPVVQNSKFILLYFGVDLAPQSKYNLCVQWSFSTLGTTLNRPSIDGLQLNGNNTTYTHNSMNILEETNYQSYYYHWYNDCISFQTVNANGPTQVKLTYSIPNVSTITQLSWHDKVLQYMGSTGQDTNTTINSAASNIINNNNQNTQNIINNNNQNTQNIINNQNENTDKTIKSQYVCKDYDYSNSAQLKSSYLSSNGDVVDSTNRGVSRYIPINSTSKVVLSTITNDSYLHTCFYNSSKEMLSCVSNASLSRNSLLTVPDNASFVRFSYGKYSPTFNICTNGSQVVNDTLTDDNVDRANADFEEWFEETHVNTHGLSSIITAPLRLIQGMLGTTCVPLTFPLPFVNQNVVLPCMTPIYIEYFGDWFNIYRLITDGVIAYWVAVNVFRKMQDFLDPTDDKVEVFDL